MWDGSGRVLDCNRSAARILGIPHHELRRMSFDALMRAGGGAMAPQSEHWLRPPAHRVPGGTGAPHAASRSSTRWSACSAPMASRVWIEIDVRPVPDGDDGDVIVSSFRDITQRKAAEDRMRTLSAIVETSSDAILRLSVDGTIESWNAGAEALYGYPAEEVIGCHLAIDRPRGPPRRAAPRPRSRRVRVAPIINLLTTRRHSDGRPHRRGRDHLPLFDAGRDRDRHVVHRRRRHRAGGGARCVGALRGALPLAGAAIGRRRVRARRARDHRVRQPRGRAIRLPAGGGRRASRTATSSTPTTSSAHRDDGARHGGDAPAPRRSSGGSGSPTGRTAGPKRC